MSPFRTLLVFSALAGGAAAAEIQITIAGSTTLHPAIDAAQKAYARPIPA